METVEAIKLIRHPRAKRLRLRLDLRRGCVTLTLPPRASLRQAQEFIAANQGWIREQQQKAKAAQPFMPDTVLDILGIPTRLGDIARSTDPKLFPKRVERVIRKQALAQFTQWAAEFSARLSLVAPQITLRDTKSRWGSCNVRGELNLSWRLALAPVEVARYVVAHEVAHRRQLNHSPAFWKLVEQLVGDYNAPERWLAREGAKLMQLGVAREPQVPELA